MSGGLALWHSNVPREDQIREVLVRAVHKVSAVGRMITLPVIISHVPMDLLPPVSRGVHIVVITQVVQMRSHKAVCRMYVPLTAHVMHLSHHAARPPQELIIAVILARKPVRHVRHLRLLQHVFRMVPALRLILLAVRLHREMIIVVILALEPVRHARCHLLHRQHKHLLRILRQPRPVLHLLRPRLLLLLPIPHQPPIPLQLRLAVLPLPPLHPPRLQHRHRLPRQLPRRLSVM